MHILLVTHYFAPENSAPTRRWAAFAERFIDHGHQVTVVAPPPHYPQGRVKDGLKQQYKPGSSAIEEYGANVFRTKYLQHRADIVSRTSDHLVAAYDSLGVAKRAAKQFGPPEVVIATAPGIPSLIAGRRIAKAFGAPLIVEMRDAWPDLVTHTAGLSGGGPKKWVKKIIHERITDWQLHSAQVVTTTQRFAEVLTERGVSSPVVIRNGTNIERYGNISERTGNDRLHLLYMGNMGRSQGLHTVIEAAAKLKAQGCRSRCGSSGTEQTNRAFGNSTRHSDGRLRFAIKSSRTRYTSTTHGLTPLSCRCVTGNRSSGRCRQSSMKPSPQVVISRAFWPEKRPLCSAVLEEARSSSPATQTSSRASGANSPTGRICSKSLRAQLSGPASTPTTTRSLVAISIS